MHIFRQFRPTAALSALLASTLSVFRTRAALQLEILALRHQLGVMQRSVKKPKLNRFDRFLWAWLCGAWAEWRSALCIAKPETVIAWHRKGFRLFWTWKVRRGHLGRPPVSKEIRKLIRKMSRENPIWSARRIHGELLKLGIDIGETSVSKYMVHRRNPPSQTWRTFLENHVKTTVSIDFFTVPAYSGEAEQHSGLKPNSIPGRPEHPSERSDAGLLIVREVFGLVKRTEGP